MRLVVARLLLWSITQGLDQRGDALPSLVLHPDLTANSKGG